MPIHIPINLKKKYQVKVHSCKEDTNVLMHLDDREHQLLQEFAVATQLESKSECQPTVFVTPVGKLKANKKEGNPDV